MNAQGIAARLGAAVLLALCCGCSPESADAGRQSTGQAPGVPVAASSTGESSPIEPGAIGVRLGAGTGFASLRIDEAWLARHGQAVLAQVRMVCRYDPDRDQWQRLPASPTRIAYRMEPLPATEARERTFFELPREAGLYWVHWIEQNEGTRSAQAVAARHELVAAGPALCQGQARQSTAQGRVAACVPVKDSAQIRDVPDPAIACAELL